MKTRHTPGPWEVLDTRWLDTPDSINAGKLINRSVVRGELVIAHISNQHEANAQAISAVPELLEACQSIFVLLEKEEPKWYLLKHYNLLKNAISKATNPQSEGKS